MAGLVTAVLEVADGQCSIDINGVIQHLVASGCEVRQAYMRLFVLLTSFTGLFYVCLRIDKKVTFEFSLKLMNMKLAE